MGCNCDDCVQRETCFNTACEKYKKIIDFQNDKSKHPLSCGKCSTKLLPSMLNGVVILECPQCGYAQEYIPKYIFE